VGLILSEIPTLTTTNEDSSDKDLTTSDSSSPSSLKNKHLWKPGQSGYPAGRPKGSKNRITVQKLAIEEALRDQLNLEMPEILLKAIEMAKGGDRSMIKLLVEMTMSKPQTSDDEAEGKERVKVTIRNLTLEHKTPERVIEGKVIKDGST
jgi:hypothetical protein